MKAPIRPPCPARSVEPVGESQARPASRQAFPARTAMNSSGRARRQTVDSSPSIRKSSCVQTLTVSSNKNTNFHAFGSSARSRKSDRAASACSVSRRVRRAQHVNQRAASPCADTEMNDPTVPGTAFESFSSFESQPAIGQPIGDPVGNRFAVRPVPRVNRRSDVRSAAWATRVTSAPSVSPVRRSCEDHTAIKLHPVCDAGILDEPHLLPRTTRRSGGQKRTDRLARPP